MQALSLFQGEEGLSLFHGVVELRSPSLLTRRKSSLDALRERSTSLSPSSQSGPAARQKHYEGMSVDDLDIQAILLYNLSI